MILETLVSVSCLYGNNESCHSGLQEYVKYYGFDKKAEYIGKNVEKKYPTAHFMGIVAFSAANKKYNAILYRNFGFNGDYSDNKDQRSSLIYKYEF